MKRRLGWLFFLFVVCFTGAALSGKVDPRAVEDCKKHSETFVQISDCVSDADVAFKTLDAFEAIYPAEAAQLKARCIELNTSGITGAATCVVEAISSAVSLAEALPPGTSLDDPIFNAVSDAKHEEKLKKVIETAREAFGRRLWGGNAYQPYR